MRNPYLATLGAYFAPWSMRISTGFVALFLLLSLSNPDAAALGGWPAIPVLIAAGVFMLIFAALTKEQFTTPLARLVPEFSRHHLMVAGLICGLVLPAIAGTLATATAATFLGVSAVLLTMLAFITWGTCIQPVVLFIFFMLAFIPSMTSAGQAWFIAIMLGSSPATSLALLAGAIASLAVVGRKLAELREEQPEYRRWFSQGTSPWVTPAHVGEQQKAAISRSRFVRRSGEKLEAFLSTPVVGLWRESRRLRLAAGYPSLAMITACVLAGAWIMLWLLSPNQPPALRIAYVVGLGVAGVWPRAWRKKLAQELVKPVERSRLMLLVGLIMGCDLFVAVSTAAVLAALAWAVVAPNLLVDPQLYHGLILTFCCIPAVVGATGLLLLIRSDLTYIMVSYALFGAGYAALLGVQPQALSGWPIISAGASILGAVLCYAAYRAWMAADVD